MSAKEAAGSVLSFIGGERSNRASAKEADRNRNFQMHMSSTAHQREVVDLRAAGLNPILSGVGGAGAATSAGSMAQMMDTITPALSTARDTERNAAEVNKLKQERSTSQAQEVANDMAAKQSDMLARLYVEQRKKVMEEIPTARSISEITANDLYSSNIDQRLDAYKAEEARRAVDRYGSSAKGLIPFLSPKLPNIFKRNPYKLTPKPNYKNDIPY